MVDSLLTFRDTKSQQCLFLAYIGVDTKLVKSGREAGLGWPERSNGHGEPEEATTSGTYRADHQQLETARQRVLRFADVAGRWLQEQERSARCQFSKTFSNPQ